ncbi:MAG: hypothetical protein ABIR29_11140 [Chthoniobacterales bacterium]
MQAALITSLALILLVLISCIAAGVVLYRRSIAPLAPHHRLLEELEELERTGLGETNRLYHL